MVDVRIVGSCLELVGESEDILDSEGTGANEGDGGSQVPAGASLDIILDQR